MGCGCSTATDAVASISDIPVVSLLYDRVVITTAFCKRCYRYNVMTVHYLNKNHWIVCKQIYKGSTSVNTFMGGGIYTCCILSIINMAEIMHTKLPFT